MIIGFDAKRAFCNRSGLGNYSRTLFNLLSKYYAGNRYILFTPDAKDFTLYRPPHPPCSTVMPVKSVNPLSSSLWRVWSIEKDIRMNECDIFHGVNNELPFTIDRCNVRKVMTVHDMIVQRYPHYFKPVDRLVYTFKSKTSLRKADKVIAISKQTSLDLQECMGVPEQKIEVVYQTCNAIFKQVQSDEICSRVRAKYNLPENYILSVGTIEERKNLLTLVRALKNHSIRIPLVAVGRLTEYGKNVCEFVEKHRMEKQVLFINSAATDDLPALYQMASVLVYPSFYEGFGLPILEALYSKTPVITSRGGCFSETGGEKSIYVDPSSEDELADALLRVLSDSSLVSEMKHAGFAYAQKFNDDAVIKKMMDVYTSLL